MKHRFLRAVATIVLTGFFAQEAALAAPTVGLSLAAVRPAMPPVKFSLPRSVAVIEDTFTASASAPVVILIQDAHTNDSGQMNLARALQEILPKEGIDLVFTEGASRDVSLSFLKKYFSPETRRDVGRSYLRKGILKGAEWVSLTGELDFTLWGVEDETLYRDAVLAYRSVWEKRARASAAVERMIRAANAVKATVYAGEMKRLDRDRAAHEAGEISPADYAERLTEAAGRLNVSLAGYPALNFLKSLRRMERSVDFEKASEEERAAVAALAPADRKLFESLELRKSGSADGRLALLEEKLGRTNGYGALKRYFRYVRKTREMDAAEVLKDLERLESALSVRAARNAEDLLLREVGLNLEVLKRLVELKLAPGDHARMKREPRFFDPRFLAGAINRKIGQLDQHYDQALTAGPDLELAVRDAEKFYDLTYRRDRAFVDHLTEKMGESRVQRAVLIAGGYHAPGLKELLRGEGISYVSLLPQVLHETDTRRYERILLAQVAAIERGERTRTASARPASREAVMTQDVMSSPFGARFASDLTAAEVNPDLSPAAIVDEASRRRGPSVPAATGSRMSERTWIDQHAAELNEWTVVSRQFEMGLPDVLLSRIREQNGEDAARFVAQLTMTGGLGALMGDLPDAWTKNGADVVAINPLYNDTIKQHNVQVPAELVKGGRVLGDYLREAMDKTDIQFSFRLPDFEHEITVQVYRTRTAHGGTPLYYLDAFFTSPQGSKVHVFNEVYPDDKYWRGVHMAVYSKASAMLTGRLAQRGEVKKKMVVVDHEVYVSLPLHTEDLPADAEIVRDHKNHTVVAAGMFSPLASQFAMLGFSESMRPDVVRGDSIDLTSYIGLAYDLITGVSVYEHTPVLSAFFPEAVHKIAHVNRDGMRNTNGALFENWQSPLFRSLLEQTKRDAGLPEGATDEELYERLASMDALRNDFIERAELAKAHHVLEFVRWLKDKQGQPAWHDSTVAYWRALQESSAEATAILERFDRILPAAAADPSLWPQIQREFGYLNFGAMLETPIVSNVRRQVPYKGPDKWLEILKMLEDPAKREAFKRSGVRVVLGGRVFDAGADHTFRQIKLKIQQLGLQSHFATIENYNIDEAPLLFRAVSGTVMLSTEFLEASATSMMKGVTNGAALIGVWGGAMPELFVIRETQGGRAVDVFAENVTHDDLVARLADGSWTIENGFLVAYSQTEIDEHAVPGKRARKPRADRLLQSLYDLRAKTSQAETRRELFYNVLASSPLVDIERSQGRAHILLWAEAVRAIEDERDLVPGAGAPGPSPEKWLSLVTLYEGERARLRPDEPQLNDLILNRILGDAALGWKVRDRAVRLLADADAAAGSGDAEKAKLLRLQVIGLVKKTVHLLTGPAHAGQLVDAYVSADPQVRSQAAYLLGRTHYQRNVLEYLRLRSSDPQSGVVALNTVSAGVHAFLVNAGSLEPVIVAVNEGEIAYPTGQAGETKAWSAVAPDGRDASKGFVSFVLGQNGWSAPDFEVQATDLHTGQTFERHTVEKLRQKGLPLGIPGSVNLQVLRIDRPQKAQAQEAVSAAVQGRFVGGVTGAEVLSRLIREALQDPDRLTELARSITGLSASQAAERYGDTSVLDPAPGSDALAGVMGLVAAIDPGQVDSIREWNPGAHDFLKRAFEDPDTAAILWNGTLRMHPTSSKNALLFSRTLNGRTIFIPVHLSGNPYNLEDMKAWFRVPVPSAPSASDAMPFEVRPDSAFVVRDVLFDRTYAREHRGADWLASGWDLGVPVRSRELKNYRTTVIPTVFGFRFQLLEVRNARTSAPAAAGARMSSIADIQKAVNAEFLTLAGSLAQPVTVQLELNPDLAEDWQVQETSSSTMLWYRVRTRELSDAQTSALLQDIVSQPAVQTMVMAANASGQKLNILDRVRSRTDARRLTANVFDLSADGASAWPSVKDAMNRHSLVLEKLPAEELQAFKVFAYRLFKAQGMPSKDPVEVPYLWSDLTSRSVQAWTDGKGNLWVDLPSAGRARIDLEEARQLEQTAPAPDSGEDPFLASDNVRGLMATEKAALDALPKFDSQVRVPAFADLFAPEFLYSVRDGALNEAELASQVELFLGFLAWSASDRGLNERVTYHFNEGEWSSLPSKAAEAFKAAMQRRPGLYTFEEPKAGVFTANWFTKDGGQREGDFNVRLPRLRRGSVAPWARAITMPLKVVRQSTGADWKAFFQLDSLSEEIAADLKAKGVFADPRVLDDRAVFMQKVRASGQYFFAETESLASAWVKVSQWLESSRIMQAMVATSV